MNALVTFSKDEPKLQQCCFVTTMTIKFLVIQTKVSRALNRSSDRILHKAVLCGDLIEDDLIFFFNWVWDKSLFPRPLWDNLRNLWEKLLSPLKIIFTRDDTALKIRVRIEM
jgi:hypothetical protein